MQRMVLDTAESLQDLLSKNRMYANGKNIQVEHLYATAAQSRWPYENVWGIYLTQPAFAWMAIWIAITARGMVRKRQLEYHAPIRHSGDQLGRVVVYNPYRLSVPNMLSRSAYLYLFDAEQLRRIPQHDLRELDHVAKLQALQQAGFTWTSRRERGRTYAAYHQADQQPRLICMDEWQVVLTGVETLEPAIELELSPGLVEQLAERIALSSAEVGEAYIVYP